MYFRSYTCITELIFVLQNLYLSYRANSCISDTEVPVGTTEHFTGTKVPIGTTEQIHYTEVPVGTTGLILILVFWIFYLSYRAYTCTSDLIQSLFWYKSTRRYYTDSLYGGTRRYHWTYTYLTDTRVPVGITGLISYTCFTDTGVPVCTTELLLI